jgi:hypothetical protein
MRKIVFFRMFDRPKSFSPSNLETLMRLPSNAWFTEYVENNIWDASLRELAEYGSLLQLEMTCGYYGRRPTGKIEVRRPKIKQKADIWVLEEVKLALATDLPSQLSPIAESLLSASFYATLGLVDVLSFDNERFKRLLDKVEKQGGKLTSIHLLDVNLPEGHHDVYQASESRGLGERGKVAIENSRKIKRLGFHLWLGEDFYSFWIADRGNGTLYQPSPPQPHQLGKLLEFFGDLA